MRCPLTPSLTSGVWGKFLDFFYIKTDTVSFHAFCMGIAVSCLFYPNGKYVWDVGLKFMPALRDLELSQSHCVVLHILLHVYLHLNCLDN